MFSRAKITHRHSGYIINILDNDPLAGTEREYKIRRHSITVWQVLEHKSCLHEIKTSDFECILNDVMAANLEVRICLNGLRGPYIDVRCHELARFPDYLAQPGRDRTTTSRTSRRCAPGLRPRA